MSLESRVTEAGEALSEGVRHATSATAAAVGRAEKAFGEAGEAVQQAAQQAWSQASGVTDDVLAASRQARIPPDRRATGSSSNRGLSPRLHRRLVDSRASAIPAEPSDSRRELNPTVCDRTHFLTMLGY
jgi:hypothetical protein